jgi:hypothetical protein
MTMGMARYSAIMRDCLGRGFFIFGWEDTIPRGLYVRLLGGNTNDTSFFHYNRYIISDALLCD